MTHFVELLKTVIECSTLLLATGIVCATIRPLFKDEEKKNG